MESHPSPGDTRRLVANQNRLPRVWPRMGIKRHKTENFSLFRFQYNKERTESQSVLLAHTRQNHTDVGDVPIHIRVPHSDEPQFRVKTPRLQLGPHLDL